MIQCAEALGAIGDLGSIHALERFCDHSAREISETCQIARDLILWRQSAAAGQEHSGSGLYQSVDPAPPYPAGVHNTEELVCILMDTNESLFKRYRAMFSLRDMNSDAAALALVTGFGDQSALFRHEIAYVLGQMQRPCTIEGLELVLRDVNEHRMVRHEAAESIGSIGGQFAELVLNKYFADAETVVQQSCEVALDTMDYWSKQESESKTSVKYL